MMNNRLPMAIYTYSNIPYRLLDKNAVVFDVEYGQIRNKTKITI